MSAQNQADQAAVVAKMKEYSTFVDQMLQPKLKEARAALAKTQQEFNEYSDLRKQLCELSESSTVVKDVDLGHGKVFCDARRDEAETVFVHVGFGFHVELKASEATDFVDKRLNFLQQVMDMKSAKVQQVQEHLASSAYILEELKKELGWNQIGTDCE